MADPRYWLGFHLTKGIGPARLERAGLGEALRESLAATRREVDLDRELARVERAGVTLLTWDDGRYPDRLRQIAGAPPVLYVKGELTTADELALAVVGTRRATSYGREVTARLAAELAEAGLTIVSGLARGIDAYAHDAALRAGGRTLAVLGCGVDVVYPADHRALAARIAERGQGALVSEYHLGTPPDAPNFPARNRLIAGLSLGVLVTEAPAKSGTSQWNARAALGRPQGRSPSRRLSKCPYRRDIMGRGGIAPSHSRRDPRTVSAVGAVVRLGKAPDDEHFTAAPARQATQAPRPRGGRVAG